MGWHDVRQSQLAVWHTKQKLFVKAWQWSAGASSASQWAQSASRRRRSQTCRECACGAADVAAPGRVESQSRRLPTALLS